MGTEMIAAFTAKADYEKIPKEAVNIAKKAILDYLGVAVAGSTERPAKILSKRVKLMGAVSEAGVIRGGFKTSADLAAWVNGTIGHAIDYDDTESIPWGFNMHPSVPVLPAVFALGERHKVSGKDILTAYIVGIEVEARIGSAIGAKNSGAGWHPTAVLGTIAATVASAKILKLNTMETQMALGIASSLASGLMRNVGTMTKPMHAGNAARNGVVAALLAKGGFTGNENIMEGESGFCSLFSGGSVNELANADSDLGDVWNIVSKGLAFKPYPSCRGTHASIDAMLHLKRRFDILPDQVAEVICNASPKQAQVLKFPRPRNGYEAKFSMQYCVVTALLNGKVTLDAFTDNEVIQNEIQTLLPKIHLVFPRGWVDPDMAQEIVVKLKDGKEYSYKVIAPKGDPANPLTYEELLLKFRECTERILKPSDMEKVIDLLWHLEQLVDITELTRIITNSNG